MPLRHVSNASLRILPRASQKVSKSPPNGLFSKQRLYSNVASKKKPFRQAIVGAGPAGFYSAYKIMSLIPDATIDMFEQLPVPFGLVRFGVAPDHPEVKNCQDRFNEVASSPRFRFIGNVAIGRDVALADLKPLYDSILFAYGASQDRRLGIPGEDLEGVYSARAFVGWYNGLPEYAHLKPDLSSETAVIIGNGNVALDVARILLSDMDRLRKSDMTDYALEVLSRSRVTKVRVVGRRGPMQASFTIKELRELLTLPRTGFTSIPSHLIPPAELSLPRPQKRVMQLLAKHSMTASDSRAATFALDFLLSPTSFNAAPTSTSALSSITFTRQKYAPSADPFSRSATAIQDEEASSLKVPTGLAFRSIGYKSMPLPDMKEAGLPFDLATGTIPNDGLGRVIAPQGTYRGPGGGHVANAIPVPGMYCAGWVKRGPTGVIASTMEDAFASAESIAMDWRAGRPMLSNGEATVGWDGISRETREKMRIVSWQDWLRIDQAEKDRGERVGKVREKLRSVEEMLAVLD